MKGANKISIIFFSLMLLLALGMSSGMNMAIGFSILVILTGLSSAAGMSMREKKIN